MAEADDGLFLIDGESAGATPWEFTAIVDDGTAAFALDGAAKQNGSYGYSATFDGASRNCYGRKALSDLAEIYVRAYVYIPSTFAMTITYTTVTILDLGDGSTIAINFGFYCHGSTVPARWKWKSEVAGINTEATSTTNFSMDAWHRIEIHWVSAADGGMEILVDGTSIISDLTGQNTSAIALDNLFVGNSEDGGGHVPAAGAVFYLDDIKASATGWVGAYSAAAGGHPAMKRFGGVPHMAVNRGVW
jgi:hypothetical protein